MERTVSTSTLDLSGDRHRLARERRIRRLFFGAAIISVGVSIAITVSLAGEAWNFFRQVEYSRLWTLGWFPRRGLFDLRTPITASILISGIATFAVALPLGLGAAVYLSEYASPRARRVLKPILEILAGIPSVVLGYFALTFINPDVVRRLFDTAAPFNMLGAALGVGILVTPLVASVSEDALRAVPLALREASYGLGARKTSTVTRVVFPAGISGIVAAVILGLSRAIGETMVVFMAAGAVGGAVFSVNPLEPGQTMTAAMAALAIGSDQVAGSGLAFQSLFFLGFVLFMLTLLLNLLSDRFVRRVREIY